MQEKSMYEREINLVQLIKYLWEKVWVMCASVVFGFVIVLGLQFLMSSEAKTSEDSQEMTNYEKEMQEYEENYAQIETEIAHLEKSIEEQITYNNNSILMKVNPYDKKSVTGQFYIDSDYQIMPELVYQNIDITTSVARAYQALATTGELAKYINEHLENPIKERYLNELISLSYTGDSVLEVRVVHTDIESARKIYDLIIEYMNQKKAEFEKNIGVYTITLLNESESASVDLVLKDSQVANLDTINTLKETLKTKQDSMDAIVMPSQGISLKLPVMGAIFGGGIAVVVLVILFLIDTTLKTEQDIALVFGDIPILGNIPVMEGKKKDVQKSRRKKKLRYMQYVGR